MAIQVKWDDDAHTIAWLEVEGQWNWTEYYAAMVEWRALLGTVEHRVDTIMDLSRTVGLPMGVMSRGASASQRSPENAGLMIFINHNAFVRAVVETFSRLYQSQSRHVFMVKSVEEARQLIVRHRDGSA